MYFNVNFNVFFKLTKLHFLVSELYIYQNARCSDNSYHLYISNELNDVNSKFKVRVYSPSLPARSANGNIAEALKV